MKSALLCTLLLSMVTFGGVSVTLQGPQNTVAYNGLSSVALYAFQGNALVTALQVCLQPVDGGQKLPITMEGVLMLDVDNMSYPAPFVNQMGCAVFAGNLFRVDGTKTASVQLNAARLVVGSQWSLRLSNVQTPEGQASVSSVPIVTVTVGPSSSRTRVSVTYLLSGLKSQMAAQPFAGPPSTTGVIGMYGLSVEEGYGALLHSFTIHLVNPLLGQHLRRVRLQGGNSLGMGPVFSQPLDYFGADGSLAFSFPAAYFPPGTTCFIIVAEVDMTLDSFPAGVQLRAPVATDLVVTDTYGVRILPTFPGAAKKY